MSTKQRNTRNSHQFAQEIGAMGGRAKTTDTSKSKTASKKSVSDYRKTQTDPGFAQSIGAKGGKAKAAKNKSR